MPDADFLQNLYLCPPLGVMRTRLLSLSFSESDRCSRKRLFASLNANFPSCRCGDQLCGGSDELASNFGTWPEAYRGPIVAC